MLLKVGANLKWKGKLSVLCNNKSLPFSGLSFYI